MQPHHHQFNAVIFDFDGVILDSEPIHYEACCYLLRNLGIELDYDEYKEKYLGLSDKNMFPQLFANKGVNISLGEIDEVIHEKVDLYTSMVKNKNTLPITTGIDQYIPNANEFSVFT